jgi:hypothetical protein
MKKILLAALFAACTLGLNAQKFGVRAGGEFATAKVDFDGIKVSDNETGFYLGAFARIAISEVFGLRPEVNYVGVKDLDQIQVPVLAEIKLIEKLHGQIGPNFGFILDAEEGTKSMNLGANLGLSYEFIDKFSVEARYNLGLTDLADDNEFDASLKLSSFQVGVAYGF